MEENHHFALLLHESATMSLVQYGTDALKFIGYGYLSFAAWDYMIASGARFYTGLSRTAKLWFLVAVPGITTAYLNFTQMQHIKKLVGSNPAEARRWVRVMAFLVFLSNVALKKGV
mgnify:FL=1